MMGKFLICFHVCRALVEPLRVGAGLEDLQDQAVRMHPPFHTSGCEYWAIPSLARNRHK